MGFYEHIYRLNRRVDELEQEVSSLRDEITSLKMIDNDKLRAWIDQIEKMPLKRINGRDYFADQSKETEAKKND